MNTNLRPYQISAIDKVRTAFEEGKKKVLIVLPTGLGKTVTMSAIAEYEVLNGGRVLFLAHRNKLLDQGAKEIETCTGIGAGFEMGRHHDKGESILVSSIQTLSKDDRLNQYQSDAFSLIMIDEAHHIASNTYKKVIDHFTGAKVLGVTATPVRGDHMDVSDLFEVVASEYTLSQAIKDSWLSPIKVRTCPVEIDVSNVALQSGDYSVSGISQSLEPYLYRIAEEIREKAYNRKIIVFVPLVDTAKNMVGIFEQIGLSADYVAGERKDSDAVMERFHQGEFQVLINALMLSEGYNEPAIDCVVNLRLTKSETLATQIIGRGTRLYPGKEDLLVLDFLWKDKSNRRKVSVKSLIAMNETYENESEFNEVLLALEKSEINEEINVFDALEMAKKDVKQQREDALAKALAEAAEKKRKQEEYEKALQKHKEYLEKAKAKAYSSGIASRVNNKLMVIYDKGQDILVASVNDPVLKMLGIEDYCPSEERWEQDPVSDAQLKMIKQLGLPIEIIACKGHASMLIDTFMRRRGEGLCSYKQAKILLQRKVEGVAYITTKQAKEAMDELIRHGWKTTDHFYQLLAV